MLAPPRKRPVVIGKEHGATAVREFAGLRDSAEPITRGMERGKQREVSGARVRSQENGRWTRSHFYFKDVCATLCLLCTPEGDIKSCIFASVFTTIKQWQNCPVFRKRRHCLS